MRFDVVLKGGRVFDPVHHVDERLDIGIREGRIAELEKELPHGEETYDVSGLTVIPGVIDMHVHVTKLLGGRVGYYMAAKTGVTTIIDYAGPVTDISSQISSHGCGMNVGCIDAVLPGEVGQSPSSRLCVEEANAKKVMIACHAGSTQQRSDIYGLQEAVEFARGQRLLMAHINAYCRGNRYHYLEELRDAFQMLRENPNIISDSHMAVNNGTSGACRNGIPCDAITVNCLKMFGYEPTQAGLAKAMKDGTVCAIASLKEENVLLNKEDAFQYWSGRDTNINVSFPANLAPVASACLTERRIPGGSPLIELAATDGGGFPRNGLVQKLLPFYRLGYLSLKEIVEKCSVNPAETFGLHQKGNLGIGADADITVLDMKRLDAAMSFAGGKRIMDHGRVTGSGGTFLTTKAGVKTAQEMQLNYQIADTQRSALYGERTAK